MTSEATTDDTTRKRLTPAQWAEARAMWASGEFNLEQLSEKFGVARETLSRRFKKDGVKKGQSALDKKVEAEIVEKAVQDVDKWRERGEKTRENIYKIAEMLNSMNIKAIRDAHGGAGLYAAQPDLKAIGMALKNLEVVKNVQWSVTGLDKELSEEDEIPELFVRELTPDDVQRIRSMQQTVDEEEEIEIGDATPYLDDDDLEEDLDGLVVEGED